MRNASKMMGPGPMLLKSVLTAWNSTRTLVAETPFTLEEGAGFYFDTETRMEKKDRALSLLETGLKITEKIE